MIDRNFLVITFVIFLLLFSECTQQPSTQELKGPYLGQTPPGMTPELFAPGIVSTGNTEWAPTFTPDGYTAFYTSGLLNQNVLVRIKFENGVWQEPELPAFADAEHNYADPYVSPDGKRLYFWSNRPAEPDGQPGNNSDLWYVDLLDDNSYGEPVRIDEIINTTDWQVFPTVSNNGNLYFSGYYADNTKGNFDVYMSELVDGKYTKPKNLGDAINTEHIEHEPYIAPDESYIIICSDRHAPGSNRWDLYISFRNPDGTWADAVNMGDKINSPAMDQTAIVTSDGKYMFFASSRLDQNNELRENWTYRSILDAINKPGNGNSDVYWVDAKVIEEIKNEQFK